MQKSKSYQTKTKIKEKVFDPLMDQTEVEDLYVNKIEETNETMQEVFDPFMDQTNDQKEYKTLNEIKEDIQDSTWNQIEKNVTCEIEDRVANANGRFPCKYCTQTFSKNIYAISHEKKSCKSRSNKI